MLKVSDIRDFIHLLDESTVHELRIETDEIKLTLKKADGSPVVATGVESANTAMRLTGTTSTQNANMVESVMPTKESKEDDSSTSVIRSPMVGTFYRASSPNSEAFVQVGDRISEHTVVCIIEAMKLMNEIEADVKGEIIEVLTENGHLVEYGQPLFRVKLA